VLAALVALWSTFYVLLAVSGGFGFDSHAYWLTRFGIDYGLDPGQRDAYLYTPAFAQAIRPLAALPWFAFAAVWSSAAGVAYVWLTRAWDGLSRVALLSLCLGDVVYGNVWWLFALVLALGLRRPALWALPVLLKITPGVGLVWFAARREWRGLFVALAVTAAVVAVSCSIAPGAWLDWLGFLSRGHDPGPFDTPVPRATRMLAGLALAAYAARSDRPRLLPLALLLSAPTFSLNGIAVLAALPRLAERPGGRQVRWRVWRASTSPIPSSA
jgi:hypothetical protein